MAKVAWITGASSGIGAEFARALAARGYRLVLVARRLDRLERLAAELGAPTECLRIDLNDDAELSDIAGRLRQEPPDLLINNAGFGTKPAFDQTDWDSQQQMHRVHIMATLQLTHAVLPGMIARGSGGIINVSSVAGFFRSVGGVSYCATKAWMNAFTEGLHLELRARGSTVRVQALCPGFTYTEFHDVMGMNRAAVNRRLWLNAADVVADSLSAIATDKWLVVPDWRYKLVVALVPRLPMFLREAIQLRSPHRRSV